MNDFDVAILGGGPAGSVCAARLAARGRRVVVLERDRHPRFHLGESLLPRSLDVLEAIGILGAVQSRFLVKRGARFVDGANENRAVRYAFADAFRPRWESAFQVPRDEFDELLFRHAGSLGAELREGWQAVRVIHEAGRAVAVEARAPDGRSVSVPARFVVDATGRDALIARASGAIARLPGLERTALFAQVRGAWRDAGEREGDIQVVVFGGEERGGEQGDAQGWFWLIPFADGRSSVGAVVSPSWLRPRRALGGAPELFRAALAEAPVLERMLASAEFLFEPRATGDFSFRVEALHGPGWIILGDAGGFIDPLFSTGAHLAMSGALGAADAIDGALALGAIDASRFDAWALEQRAGAELFLGAVQAFYAGELIPYIFADPQHPFLRRAVTSMLSGDVFDTSARWVREMRTRFPARH